MAKKSRNLKAANLARAIWRTVGYCEYDRCGGQLQGAHIYGTGAYPRLRDDLRNGLSLAAHCHRRFTDNPMEFTDWIRTTKYKKYLQPLLDKHNAPKQFVDWDDRLIFLKDVLKQIEAGELTLDEARGYDS